MGTDWFPPGMKTFLKLCRNSLSTPTLPTLLGLFLGFTMQSRLPPISVTLLPQHPECRNWRQDHMTGFRTTLEIMINHTTTKLIICSGKSPAGEPQLLLIYILYKNLKALVTPSKTDLKPLDSSCSSLSPHQLKCLSCLSALFACSISGQAAKPPLLRAPEKGLCKYYKYVLLSHAVMFLKGNISNNLKIKCNNAKN